MRARQPNEICNNCMFSQVLDTDQILLQCLRYPPKSTDVRLIKVGDALRFTAKVERTMTMPEYWCGEYQDKVGSHA